MDDKDAIGEFHTRYYHDQRTWSSTCWMGIAALKCPLDLWIYQELLWQVRPEVIIESGTAAGGTAFFLATMCDLLGQGEVITIDVVPVPGRPQHARLTYITANCLAEETVRSIRAACIGRSPVMVILDSDHHEGHVVAEMERYADLVTPGSYLIVEDTNLDRYGLAPAHGPGPLQAVQAFLARRTDFVQDNGCERHLLTFNPGGYLKRVGVGGSG